MKLTPEKLAAFCAALAQTCNVGKACAAIGICRWTAYTWRRDMPEFADAWDEAMKAGLTGLEDEAHRRAFEGIDKPLTHQGRFTNLTKVIEDPEAPGGTREVPVLDRDGKPVVAAVKEYSDTLAIFLLKAHAPDKYRDNSRVEMAGSLALTTLSDDEIDSELETLLAAEAAHKPPAAPPAPPADDLSAFA